MFDVDLRPEFRTLGGRVGATRSSYLLVGVTGSVTGSD